MPFLKIDHKRIHYTDYTPQANARGTIICHHGLGSSQNFYSPIVPALTSACFRVITFDVPGAARSPPSQEEQSIASLASDVLAILDALSVTHAIVVGHSMGGVVAAHLAATKDDRIQAAVLIGPVYPSDILSSAFEKRIEVVGREGMDAMANTVPFTAPAPGASPLVRAFIRELLLGQTEEGYLSHCRVICNATRPAYEDVKCSVLLIAGDEDRSADLGMCRRMFEEIGSNEKTLEVLKGVGHWHCLEAPDVVVANILGFLEEI